MKEKKQKATHIIVTISGKQVGDAEKKTFSSSSSSHFKLQNKIHTCACSHLSCFTHFEYSLKQHLFFSYIIPISNMKHKYRLYQYKDMIKIYISFVSHIANVYILLLQGRSITLTCTIHFWMTRHRVYV